MTEFYILISILGGAFVALLWYVAVLFIVYLEKIDCDRRAIQSTKQSTDTEHKEGA